MINHFARCTNGGGDNPRAGRERGRVVSELLLAAVSTANSTMLCGPYIGPDSIGQHLPWRGCRQHWRQARQQQPTSNRERNDE